MRTRTAKGGGKAKLQGKQHYKMSELHTSWTWPKTNASLSVTSLNPSPFFLFLFSILTSSRRRIVTEAELDHQASLKRHAEEQAAHMEENDGDDVGDDEWQQPSAYSKLIGLLQKDKGEGTHKRRKLAEESIEIGSGDISEEEGAEEVELTKAQIKMLERKFGVEYIERLEAGDVDPDELIAALEEENMGSKKAKKDKMPKDGEGEEERTGEGESENMDIEIEEEADHDEQDDEEQGQDRDDAGIMKCCLSGTSKQIYL